MRVILLIVGVVALLMGLLWIGQGLGVIMWPSSSFMLADRRWALNGAVVAIAGTALIWLFGRRRGE